MSVNRCLVLALLSLACSDGKESVEGTAVGNPGTLSMDVALSSGLTVTSALVPIIAVTVTDIDGGETVLLEGGDLDFLGDSLEVPPGEYNGLTYEFADNLEITGQRARDASTGFILPLFVRSIELKAQDANSIVVDGGDFGMTLGVKNFLHPVELALVEGEEVLVEDEEIRSRVTDALNESSAGQRNADGVQERTLQIR